MANTFTSAATGSRTDLLPMYTCPAATTSIIHAIYLSNVDGTNDATVNVAVSGSATFQTRRYLLKTVDVPADSTVVIEKPINLGAGDKLETQSSANDDIDVFASILEIT
ncbi:MAG TPA: hypothetical protein DEO59_02210 [Balneola sp.]|jgi:hypothetical protein|nr:hypothetical protein [Balneola sp.]|tara:strand:- start:391 stop:717 length:327 start_codon:yes stop_codon:yes gene_type:complete